MKSIGDYVSRAKRSFTKLPDKKQYVELVTATLTIPVLATAILLNFNNLRPKTDEPKQPAGEKIIVISPSEKETGTTVQPTSGDCKKGLAPLEISYPEENENVSDNPVNIDITYDQGEYCAAVWSYRINGGKWSDYDDRSIALYNLPQGTIRFELRVKSIVTAQEKNYTRTFTYSGDSGTVTPTLTQSPTSSTSAQ